MTRDTLMAIVMVTLVATAAGSAAAETDEPALTVEQTKIDVGEITSGSDAVATYVFRNSGPTDVKILRAKPS
jgi:hypothetical protein